MADTGTYLNAVMVLSGKCAALRQQLADANAEIARLRAALETIALNAPDGLPVASYPHEDAEYHVALGKYEMAQIARKALEGGK